MCASQADDAEVTAEVMKKGANAPLPSDSESEEPESRAESGSDDSALLQASFAPPSKSGFGGFVLPKSPTPATAPFSAKASSIAPAVAGQQTMLPGTGDAEKPKQSVSFTISE